MTVHPMYFLSFVLSHSSSTRKVLKKIPNIRKLEIQIVLTSQDEDCNQRSCFSHIFLPRDLDTFKMLCLSRSKVENKKKKFFRCKSTNIVAIKNLSGPRSE